MSVVHLIIKGKVQGVFFRASARDKARVLGISGWVKNTPAGDVEIMAAGSESALQDFITWCRNGPDMAKVTEVVITLCHEKEIPEGFNIIR